MLGYADDAIIVAIALRSVIRRPPGISCARSINATTPLKLLVWAGDIVALLLLPVSRKLERQHEHTVVAEPLGPQRSAGLQI